MATLGNSANGNFFNISGSYNQFAGGPYTVPDPGMYPTALSFYGQANGGSSTARNYLWLDNGSGRAGTTIYSGSSGYTLGTTLQTWSQTSIALRGNPLGYSDGYIPGGTQIWIGVWVNSASYQARGSGSSGTSDIGTGGDGSFVYHDVLSPGGNSFGYLAAQVTYTPATPVITGMSDTNIYAGEVITLSGYAFKGATGVGFNGTSASTFTVNSNSQITVTVPNNITAGNVTVTNANGTGTGPAYGVVGGYVFRSGAWAASQGVFIFRSGAWQPVQGVFAYRGGVWQPAQ